jgi:hypothetical protein
MRREGDFSVVKSVQWSKQRFVNLCKMFGAVRNSTAAGKPAIKTRQTGDNQMTQPCVYENGRQRFRCRCMASSYRGANF